MKTLNEAVQIAIINEAGSTYRNYLLCAVKYSTIPLQQDLDNAEKAAQVFISLCNKNLASTIMPAVTIRGTINK